MNYEWNDDLDEELIIEDIIETPKSRKKKNAAPSKGIIFGCVLILVLVTCLAGVFLVWLNKDKVGEQGDAVTAVALSQPETEEQATYTQEELDAQIATAVEDAKAQATAEVLSNIKGKLENGDSTVETMRELFQDDIVLASNNRIRFIPINRELQLNSYVEENLRILENGEYQYVDGENVISHKGIDVSKFQGTIDWDKVAADGVEFAFVRVGFRGYGTGKLVEDETFDQNMKGALSAGIKVGVYFYTQAVTEEELLEEANFVLEKIAPYKIECPVVFDVEKVSGDDGRMNGLSVEERTNLTLLFCQTIDNAGYKPMIYHNMEMGALMLDIASLEKYDKWFAYYNQDMYYPYAYKIWQYSDEGVVDGIKGPVDLNISFEPLWE